MSDIQRLKARLAEWVWTAQTHAKLLGPSPARRHGAIEVCGYLTDRRGVGRGAQLALEAFQRNGFNVAPLDVSAFLKGGPAPAPREAGPLIMHTHPVETAALFSRWPKATWADRYRVGYWVWELPVAPPDWKAAVDWFDEIWTPSPFSKDALSHIAQRDRLRVMPHPLAAMPGAERARAVFSLPDAATLVFTAFDVRSSLARKNPRGAIDAYCTATPTPRADRGMVVKVLGAEAQPSALTWLRSIANARGDIHLIDAELETMDMARLITSCDIVVSLHRAEGFGLLIAEAMQLGLPVVATGWSGVLSWVDAQSAALVRFTMTDAVDASERYKIAGAQWAEPDVGHAARLLEDLLQSPDQRRVLGVAGKARIESVLAEAYAAHAFSAAFRDHATLAHAMPPHQHKRRT